MSSDQPKNLNAGTNAHPVSAPKPSAWPHWTTYAWVALIALVLVIQWPMIKGWYYKTSGVDAPAGAIAWRTDYDAALAESRQTGMPVLIDFTADWCPPCQVMKHEVWPDDAVAAAVNAGYIPLLIDVDAQPAVANRYGVYAIPTIVVTDGDGQVTRMATVNQTGRDGMVEFLSGDGS